MRFKHLATQCGVLLLSCSLGLFSSSAQADEKSNKVNVWNWSDYVAHDTLSRFEAESKLELNHVLFDNTDLVEARLLSGNTGFDAVMITSFFVPRLAKAGAIVPIDKSLISNYKNLDPKRMELLSSIDKDNAYAIPYAENTVGIGYNTKKIKEIFGEDFKVDSWDLIFKEENMSKLGKCGVAVLDNPMEMVTIAQIYLGKDYKSEKKADYEDAKQLLTTMAKNVTYFHSSRYINDLASGDICVAIGYSGDLLQSKDRAKLAKRDYDIEYVFPKEGSLLWFDSWVIAKGVKNFENAHKWIDFLMQDDVAADIANEIRYILPVTTAYDKFDKALWDNPSVNLSEEDLKKAVFPDAPTKKQTKIHNEIWNYMKLNSHNDEEDAGGWV